MFLGTPTHIDVLLGQLYPTVQICKLNLKYRSPNMSPFVAIIYCIVECMGKLNGKLGSLGILGVGPPRVPPLLMRMPPHSFGIYLLFLVGSSVEAAKERGGPSKSMMLLPLLGCSQWGVT